MMHEIMYLVCVCVCGKGQSLVISLRTGYFLWEKAAGAGGAPIHYRRRTSRCFPVAFQSHKMQRVVFVLLDVHRIPFPFSID